MPKTIAGFIWRHTRGQQVLLVLLSIAVFLLNTAPLELQRRIVNDAFKHGDFHAILLLAVAYAGLALAEGIAKVGLNVYGAYVSENTSRRLRRTVYRQLSSLPHSDGKVNREGTEISIMIDEIDAIGGFVGISVSQPVLQVGILASVLGYLVFLQPVMAVLGFFIFVPQLTFVPLMQGAINRRTQARIRTLREMSGSIVADHDGARPDVAEQNQRIENVFSFNMGIYKLKFSMNFLMNLQYHVGIAAVLALGGWYVVQGSIEVGTIVAFVSGLAKANDPWGETINWYREMMVVSVKYRLIAGSVETMLEEGGVSMAPASSRSHA